jgi:hypothetical protein
MVENQGRDVTGMSVAEADKATALGRLVDSGLEDPEILGWPAESQDGLGVNAGTMIFLGDSEQIRVSDVLRQLNRLASTASLFLGTASSDSWELNLTV